MINIFKNPVRREWKELCKRAELDKQDLTDAVNKLLCQVKSKGDQALFELTQKYDKADLKSLIVTEMEVELASQMVPDQLKVAIKLAKTNIEQFHKSQVVNEGIIETIKGVKCWRKSVGIEKVGLYIPGGSAPLFSTILMLGIPATIAGCKGSDTLNI